MSRNARGLVVFVVFFSLSLPVTASANPGRQERQDPAERFFVPLWERLASPLATLVEGIRHWAVLSSDTVPPPPPASNPGDNTDGRAILDPIG